MVGRLKVIRNVFGGVAVTAKFASRWLKIRAFDALGAIVTSPQAFLKVKEEI